MTKILIITGAAPCVMDDLTALAMDDSVADFMAIGLDAVDKYRWPIKYVATYHPEDIPGIRERREQFGGNFDYLVISIEVKAVVNGVEVSIVDGVDIVEPYRPPSGSSALLGVLAGLRIGYSRIILCGCPMTGKNAAGGKYDSFQEGWTAVEKELAGRVRSMSGWTREFLSAPTEEWLKGPQT